MKRSRIKRKPPRRGAMPPEVYQAVMGRAGGRCEAEIETVCTGRAQEFHHRRSVGVGRDPHTVGNGVALCSACHYFITHVSPSMGREMGLIVSRHYVGDPADKPVHIRTWRGREWVFLTEGGGYRRWEGE